MLPFGAASQLQWCSPPRLHRDQGGGGGVCRGGGLGIFVFF